MCQKKFAGIALRAIPLLRKASQMPSHRHQRDPLCCRSLEPESFSRKVASRKHVSFRTMSKTTRFRKSQNWGSIGRLASKHAGCCKHQLNNSTRGTGKSPPHTLSANGVLSVGRPALVSLLASYPDLCFHPHVAHPPHDVVTGLLVVFQGYYLNRVGGVVWTQDQVVICGLDILDRTSSIFAHGVHVILALAVGSHGVIVAVEQ